MENNRLLLIGGGGHCHSVADTLLDLGKFEHIGIVEKAFCSDNAGKIPVVGIDDDLPRLFAQGWSNAFITVGSIGDTTVRRRIYEKLKFIGFNLPVIIDASAVVSKDTIIEEGVFIGKNAVVNAGSKLGKCVIVNTSATIEHDCNVGDFAHISPGAVLCGQVTVGNDTHIGAGSVVIQQITLGSDTIIGAGGAVVSNIGDNSLAFGNPCKVVKKI